MKTDFLLGSFVGLVTAVLNQSANAQTPKLFLHLEDLCDIPVCAAGTSCPSGIDQASTLGQNCPSKTGGPPRSGYTYSQFFPPSNQVVPITGPQIELPWSALVTPGTSTLNQALLDSFIRPWASNKPPIPVGLSFYAVDNHVVTPPAALPTSISNTVILIKCSDSTGKTLPDVPVYWYPSFQNSWSNFINSVQTYLAGSTWASDVAYLRFGDGVADESFAAETDPGACSAKDNTGRVFTGSFESLMQQFAPQISYPTTQPNTTYAAKTPEAAFYNYVTYFQNIVNSITNESLALNTQYPTSPLPNILQDVNDLAHLQAPSQPKFRIFVAQTVQTDNDALLHHTSRLSMSIGNEGFGSQTQPGYQLSTKFPDIYGWANPPFSTSPSVPPFYFQTASPQNQTVEANSLNTLPCIIYNTRTEFGSYFSSVGEIYYNDATAAFTKNPADNKYDVGNAINNVIKNSPPVQPPASVCTP